MVDLGELAQGIENFDGWSHTGKIKLFAWHLHTSRAMERFAVGDIRQCFDDLHADRPSNISQLLADLQQRREMLRDARGYYLERKVRTQIGTKYGQRSITVQVLQTLRELPAKLPSLEEQMYLEEALTCFKSGAFRASIVMTWNVAYDHLCSHILTNKLVEFNARLAKQFKKDPIRSREDFHPLTDAAVLEVCRGAGITSKNVHSVLTEKLNTRNRAAHASGSTFEQPQAEAYILDLVNNALLQIRLPHSP